MTGNRNGQAGMSLLEVTFAAGIMATALSLLFGSLISISLVGKINEDKTVANTEISSVLESLRGMDYNDLLTFTPETPSSPGIARTVTLECFNADGTALALPLAADAELPDLPNPLEVQVTLLWTNDKGHIFQAHTTTSIGR